MPGGRAYLEGLLGTLAGYARDLITVLAVIGSIAFIHELGHYLVAKLCGVRVDEFSLGIGRALWTRKWGETEYNLRVFPFAAYVRPAGMDPEEEFEAGQHPGERSFQAKGFWAKQAILFGGPLANFVGTMLLLVAIYWWIGIPPTNVLVKDVMKGGPAELAGIRAGDVLTHFDGVEIKDRDAAVAQIFASPERSIRMRVQRKVEGREPSVFEVPVVPVLDGGGGRIRIVVGSNLLLGERVRMPFMESVAQASHQTWTFATTIYGMTVGLLARSFGRMEIPKEVGGPIKIISEVIETSRSGLENVLYMTAQLSLSIGVFNLLPFPALDGGRMLLLFILVLADGVAGLLRRPPVSESDTGRRIEEGLHVAGFLFLILLMVAVSWKDLREKIWSDAPGPVPPAPAVPTGPPAPSGNPR